MFRGIAPLKAPLRMGLKTLRITLVAGLVLPVALMAKAEQAPDPDRALWEAREMLLAGDGPGAMGILQPLADQGHPRAQTLIAMALAEAQGGLARDPETARSLLTEAAARGYPPALFNLGILQEWGLALGEDGQFTFRPDLEAARDSFLAAAVLDYPPALARAGMMLIEARGGPQDTQQGLRLLRRAVELGDPHGHAMLGLLHINGVHVERDAALARHHSLIAALQGHGGGRHRVLPLLLDGIGGPVDLIAAAMVLEVAARQGDSHAAFELGRMMMDAPEVFPDPVAGLAWCQTAARMDPPARGRCEIEGLDLTDEDRARARELGEAILGGL